MMQLAKASYVGLTLVVLTWIGCSLLPGGSSTEELEALFVFEIEPLLETKCVACHGGDPEEIEGDFNLTHLGGLLDGGASGDPAIVPGSVEESPLFAAINRVDPDLAMPPKVSEKLTAEEISFVHDWIEGGSPWPADDRKTQILADPKWRGKGKVTVPVDGALAESWANRTYRLEDLWAYRPIQREFELPEGIHPVDYFIQEKLDEMDLQASEPASKETLIRRLYFDLLGLPPTYAQVQDFVQQEDPVAVSDLIDTLLQKSAYGEQMARRWLDVVRYADSDGFSNDYVRPSAWRYRDYVIRSFNNDKPFNEFVVEQIAGDELDPTDPEMLIATGFLRMGPWEHTGMSVAKETRQFFLDDVVNSVGETFLSIPLMCAKCHDHKFDPIPTKDYYQVQAVFATTQFADREAQFLPDENRVWMDEEQARIQEWIKETKEERARIDRKEENAAAQWFRERGRPYLTKKTRRSLPDDRQPPRYLGLTYADLGYRKVLNKRMQTLQALSRRFQPYAYAVYNGGERILHSGRLFSIPEENDDELPKSYLLQAGSVFSPGEEVSPGVLQAIPAVLKMEQEEPSSELALDIAPRRNGRRLALANWLVNRDHPIAARSIANRVWQYHFGIGLAEDANNFGVSAKKPSHPELLDFLANYLMNNGWSIKKLHRLILTSAAYQRSAVPVDPIQSKLVDPENQFLAHFNSRRLHAEELRDGILQITGELNLMVGGIPIRPEINEEVALQPRHIMGSIAPAYQPSRLPDQRNRRTIYAERIRSLQNPFLSVFNQPGTDISCGRRSLSTIAPQVLALFNGPSMRNRAVALASILTDEHHSLEDKIKGAYARVWLRTATAQEVTQGSEYVEKMMAYHRDNKTPPIVRPTKVKRKMFEEMTGEPFEYIERLDVYEDYVADPSYHDVSVETRALSDLCLVLFNSNEFVYVY
ncbi:MAG: DUF1549 domain-containing protein [Saprospiraceae bacterium]|nr:DUF1549 domain-containing protein [Saprospiraceae bacterium]